MGAEIKFSKRVDLESGSEIRDFEVIADEPKRSFDFWSMHRNPTPDKKCFCEADIFVKIY